MSLLKKTATRTTKTGVKKSAGKTAKRVLATASAGLMLFSLAACGPKEKVEVQPEEPKNSQQATFNELQEQLQLLQSEMNGLKQDVTKLKENDAAMLELISSNMTIVQNLISDLQTQIANINERVGANKQDIENLKQSQTAIADQLSTLQTNMQQFAAELETLKGQTSDKSDNKTIKNLQNSVAAMQSQINKLTLQNAISYTLNTRYNYVTDHGYKDHNGIFYEMYTAPNGDFAYCGSKNANDDSIMIGKDELVFTNIDGKEEILLDYVGGDGALATPMDVMVRPLNRATDIQSEKDENGAVIYTFTDPKTEVDYEVSIGDSGYIGDYYADGAVCYSFMDDSKQNFESNMVRASNGLECYRDYEGIKAAFEESFNYKYGILSGTMEYEDKSTVDVKCVTSPNKYAICQTENSETNSRTGVFVTNYGSLFEENGEIESYDGGVSGGTNEVMTMPSLGNLFFSEIFSRGATGESIATISFNEATNTYTIVQTPSQNGVGRSYVDTCEVTLDENGKIATVTTIYKEDNETQTATYHLEGINKAAFEKEFNEIKAIYEELLAKKNGNEAVL